MEQIIQRLKQLINQKNFETINFEKLIELQKLLDMYITLVKDKVKFEKKDFKNFKYYTSSKYILKDVNWFINKYTVSMFLNYYNIKISKEWIRNLKQEDERFVEKQETDMVRFITKKE